MNFSEFLYFKTLPDEGMQVCRRSMSIRYLEMGITTCAVWAPQVECLTAHQGHADQLRLDCALLGIPCGLCADCDCTVRIRGAALAQ